MVNGAGLKIKQKVLIAFALALVIAAFSIASGRQTVLLTVALLGLTYLIARNAYVPLKNFFFQNQSSSQCRGVANKEYVYVSPYGDVQPCCFMPLSFGNIREEPLKTILERMWKHPMYSESSIFKECPMLSDEFRKKYIDTIPSDMKLPFEM